MSNLRLRDSINKLDELIDYAIELGHTCIAITEHETVANAILIEEKWEKIKEEYPDFKIIKGNEIYLCRNGLNAENFTTGDRYFHFILLAKDAVGHQQIRELSTRAWMRSYQARGLRRVPTYYQDLIDIVESNRGHIIASTACLGGYLPTKLLEFRDNRDEQLFENICSWIKRMDELFGHGNFYLEMQPSNNDDQIYVNRAIVRLSEILDIPYIITTDSHYKCKEDAKVHKAFLNSQDGEREVDEFYATTYMMSAEEIHDYMDKYNGKDVISQLLENTKLIGEQITEYDLRKPFKLPYRPSEYDIKKADEPYNIAENITNPIWKKFLYSSEMADRVFIKRIIDSCNMKLNRMDYWEGKRLDRMETELEIVWNASEKQNLKWSKYFLQVADYIKIAWDEGDTIVGPGRGSGVGFYLNYLLNIIQIDPMVEKVPLFYWRLGLIAS